MKKPTIYEALKAKLGREPLHAEIMADVKRILQEASIDENQERFPAVRFREEVRNVIVKKPELAVITVQKMTEVLGNIAKFAARARTEAGGNNALQLIEQAALEAIEETKTRRPR